MIFIQPTRYGAGITLWGDPFDLDHIRHTIHACADETIWGEPVAFYLLALACDIRHACQGDRLEKQFVSEAKPGKARFRKLPPPSLHFSSLQYNQFRNHVQRIADEQRCEPFQLRVESEWPEFKWERDSWWLWCFNWVWQPSNVFCL